MGYESIASGEKLALAPLMFNRSQGLPGTTVFQKLEGSPKFMMGVLPSNYWFYPLMGTQYLMGIPKSHQKRLEKAKDPEKARRALQSLAYQEVKAARSNRPSPGALVLVTKTGKGYRYETPMGMQGQTKKANGDMVAAQRDQPKKLNWRQKLMATPIHKADDRTMQSAALGRRVFGGRVKYMRSGDKVYKIAEAKPERQGRTRLRRLLKAGPAIGATIGGAVGAAKGKSIKSTLTGASTGAGVGWLPEVYADAADQVKKGSIIEEWTYYDDLINECSFRKLAQDPIIEVPRGDHPVVLKRPIKRKGKDAKFPFQAQLDFQGLKIDVENKRGSYRKGKGKDKDGNEWKCYMHHHYGEIRNTRGVDGDNLDAYVGPNHDSSLVVVIHQCDPSTGKYDEDKVMLGFNSLEEAIGAYKNQYDKPGFYQEGKHTEMPIGRFWRWVRDRKNHGKKVASWRDKLAGTPFLQQDRPDKVKEIFSALKRDHPNMPAEVKARIAARKGKSNPQSRKPPETGGPAHKAPLRYVRDGKRYVRS